MDSSTKRPIISEDLMVLGYTPGPAFGIALRTANRLQHLDKDLLLAQFADLLAAPEDYTADTTYGELASALIEKAAIPKDAYIPLRNAEPEYTIYGEQHIEPGARSQMDVAMQLPVAVGGALM